MTRRNGALVLALAIALAAARLATVHAADPAATQATASPRYQCAMHPQIVSDRPGICPICQMPLQRVDVDTDAPPSDAAVPDHAAFTLSAARQQLIGVTRGRVERRPLALTLRVPGTVASDPDLYRLILEYREARRAAGGLALGGEPERRGTGAALVDAARLKLRRAGLSPAEIQALDRDERDPTALVLPGEQAWVYAQVAAAELDLVHAGQAVTVTTPAAPGTTYRATIAGVDPILDPTTRRARVRIPLATPGGALRPGTFVHVVIDVPLGDALAVPADAVLDTGTRQLVFVVRDADRFEPRSVRLGHRAGDFYAVEDGLAAGDEVVTSANFLIDSESRFRSAVAGFQERGAAPDAPGATP